MTARGAASRARAPRGPDPRIALLLRGLDGSFDRKSWHGTPLRGALRGMDPAAALWRPAPGQRCAWDLLLHCAYWKYVVRRWLTEGEKGSFPREPSNWPRLPEPADAAALRRDLRLLGDQHRRLRAALAALPPARLDEPTPNRPLLLSDVIQGVAAHDLHHGGQIQLLKRLRRGAP